MLRDRSTVWEERWLTPYEQCERIEWSRFESSVDTVMAVSGSRELVPLLI